MNSSEFKSNIRSFNEADSWNTSRYIVYFCEYKRNEFWFGSDRMVALQTDNIMKALSFIKKNSDRIHHYKLYDRKLVSFNLRDIMRTAQLEEEEKF